VADGVITTEVPGDWKALQAEVARILEECGLAVQVEKTIATVRGTVEVDVFAEESVTGRIYTLVCECKRWKTNVPQTVIHAFRTVVTDSGANVGYIISSAGFQTGAFTAAELTNLRLVTWEDFQSDFEQKWLEQFLMNYVAERFDTLFNYTEYLMPRVYGTLSEEGQRRFSALNKKYSSFGWMMMTFTPYAHAFVSQGAFPELPLRNRVNPQAEGFGPVPDSVLDAGGYREFLNAADAYRELAMRDFEQVIAESSSAT
jgi:hypothetical protein